MRMRFFFILPDEYARVSCPLSSFTLKRASGSSSCTVPSNSIRSSLGKQISLIRDGGAKAPRYFACFSNRTQVHRRDAAALALLEFVADPLAFTEVVHPSLLDGGDVNKDVTPGSLGLDEPIALLRVEPFDRTGRHQQDST